MSSTDLPHDGTRRMSYTMSGTDSAYAATGFKRYEALLLEDLDQHQVAPYALATPYLELT
eukprot:1217704-Rhodomonas_salina.3